MKQAVMVLASLVSFLGVLGPRASAPAASVPEYMPYCSSSQVMSQIGSTAGQAFDDPNVLTDNVLHFYTVDEPGW